MSISLSPMNPRNLVIAKTVFSALSDGTGVGIFFGLKIEGPTLEKDKTEIHNTDEPNSIRLTFDQDLDKTSAENTANYAIEKNGGGEITIDLAALADNSRTVTLTLATGSTISDEEALAGITVTPSENLENAFGDGYNNGYVIVDSPVLNSTNNSEVQDAAE